MVFETSVKRPLEFSPGPQHMFMAAQLNRDVAIRDAVDGPRGYWVGPLLTDSEVAGLRDLIRRRFLDRIAVLAPNSIDHFAGASLTHYHREAHRIDHASAWPRHARLMDRDGVAFVERSSFMRRLRAVFGSAEISNEIEGSTPEIVWRLVRPGASDDIGPLHADRWFWEINRWPIPPGRRCIKVWLMVHGNPGRAGLRVVPGSHNDGRWAYGVERRHGMDKPVFDEAAAGIAPALLVTPPGSAVVFSYALLHGGAVTEGDQCRVSVEFTLFVPAKGSAAA